MNSGEPRAGLGAATESVYPPPSSTRGVVFTLWLGWLAFRWTVFVADGVMLYAGKVRTDRTFGKVKGGLYDRERKGSQHDAYGKRLREWGWGMERRQ